MKIADVKKNTFAFWNLGAGVPTLHVLIRGTVTYGNVTFVKVSMPSSRTGYLTKTQLARPSDLKRAYPF
jgi:hypothetical protein